MKKLLFGVLSVLAGVACGGVGEIFVDKASQSLTEDGSSENPYKTLQAAMEHPGLGSGDTVWVAEGVYDEGAAEGGENSNRVVVVAGVTLRATGAKEKTIIEGSPDPDTLSDSTLKGIGPRAVRCAYMNNGSVIRGFTLRNGRCRANVDLNGYGGCACYGTFVDCVITGNRGRRGGAMSNATLIRCLVKDNTCTYSGEQTIGCSFYNCIGLATSGSYHFYQNGVVVNSTFTGVTGTHLHLPLKNVYNSIVANEGLRIGVAATYSNTIIASAFAHEGTNLLTFVDCVITKDLTQAKLGPRYAPWRGTPAVGRCSDFAAYKALFPAGFEDEADYDYYGNPRVRAGETTFSCGAVEYDPEIDGEMSLYVDPVNGSDTYAGARKGLSDHPYKTLQAAMEDARLKTGDTIWARPGTYDEGGKETFAGSPTTNRVYMREGVTLRSTDGAAQTIIQCGANIRGVYMVKDTRLRGFTIQDAQLNKNVTLTQEKERNGGAVYGEDTSAAILDCVMKNCSAVRGGAVQFLGSIIRCRFSGNKCSNTGNIGYLGASYYNCFFDSRTVDGYALYCGGKLVNCTYVGGVNATVANKDSPAYNCVLLNKYTDHGGTTAFTTCCFGYSGTKPTALCDSTCIFRNSAAELGLYTGPSTPKADSLVRNICTDYAAYKALFPADLQDEADFDVYGQPRLNGSETTFDAGCYEYNPDFYRSEWYVDAVNGSDTYEGADKGTLAHPYKTLQAAMENPFLAGEQTVWALPGAYDEGGLYDSTRKETTRVTIPDGVRLVSTEGALKTSIVGHPGTGKKIGQLGADSVRCVILGKNAFLKGFTVTGGHAASNGEGGYGAGVNGVGLSSPAEVEDCILRECCSERNSAAYRVLMRRCRVVDNYVTSIGCVGSCYLYNCYFGPQKSNVSYISLYNTIIENCTFNHGYSSGTAVHLTSWTQPIVKNCVILGAVLTTASTTPGVYDKCVLVSNCGLSKEDLGTSVMMTRAEMLVDDNGAPLAGSPLIDAGSDALYHADKGGAWDFSGGTRQVGTAIDVGAFEYDATRSSATLADPLGLLTVPEFNGETTARPAFGGSLTYTVQRKLGGSRLASGVTIGETTYSFADYPDGVTHTVPFSGVQETITPVACETWYVDAVNGNNANLGDTPSAAKESFFGIISENPYFAAGDTINALPGEYTNGIFNANIPRSRCRLQVPANTKVFALEGPEKTIIRGARAYGEGLVSGDLGSKWGLGSNTVRTVYAPNAGAVVRGFTLADGACFSNEKYSGEYETGANVNAHRNAYFVDCVITNGVAQRGGGASGGSFVNCLFTGNIGAFIGATLNADASLFGCIVEKSKNSYVWHCSSAAGVSNIVVNTLFTTDNANLTFRDVRSTIYVFNSLDFAGANYYSSEGLPHYFRSACKGLNGVFADNCVTNLTKAQCEAILDGIVPKKGGLAVDAGNNAYYDQYWPEAFKTNLDIRGGARIYNGSIDLGPAEFDWRGDFAKNLRLRRLEVLAASAGVKLGSGRTLDLAADASITLRFAFSETGTATFKVVGAGATILAKLGETTLVPSAAGVYTFEGEKGETYDVTISVADAAAVLSKVRVPGLGVVILVQ